MFKFIVKCWLCNFTEIMHYNHSEVFRYLKSIIFTFTVNWWLYNFAVIIHVSLLLLKNILIFKNNSSHIHYKLLTVKLYSYHVLHYNYSDVFWYLQIINIIYTAPMCSLQMIKTPQKLITLCESQIEQSWSTFNWVWNL